MLWELVGVVAASTGEATYINKPTETICMHKLFVGFFMYAYFSQGPSPKRICIHKLCGAKVYVYIFFSSVFLCMCGAAHFFPHSPGNRPGETLADFFPWLFGEVAPTARLNSKQLVFLLCFRGTPAYVF